MAPFQPLQPWAPAGCLGVALAASASFSHFRPTWDPLNFNLDWSWVLGRFGWKLCRIRAGKINQKYPDKPSKHFFPYNATNSALGYKSCWCWLCQDCASSVLRHVPCLHVSRHLAFLAKREKVEFETPFCKLWKLHTRWERNHNHAIYSTGHCIWVMISWFTRFLLLCR